VQRALVRAVFQAVHILAALLGLTTWELAEVQVQQVALATPSGAALEVVVLFLHVLADEVKVLFMAALVAVVVAPMVQMARLEEKTVILEVAGLLEVLAV